MPKPDETFPFCTDYRHVNTVTRPYSFPLPQVEDCIDRVGSGKYVTKLDIGKFPLQTGLQNFFVTPDLFMQYTVMTFGLQSVPNCSAYLDDLA